MFYKILINGTELGVFGHQAVQNIHLSVSGGSENMFVFASAVCMDNGKLVHYDWLQHDLTGSDVVQIEPTTQTNVAEPRKKFVMNRGEREASSERSCDFCQRNETEVPRLIYIDEHRPTICSSCLELCYQLLQPKESP
jgi:hypothetical protein